MLSLDDGPGAKQIAMMYVGDPDKHDFKQKGKPVFWYRKKDEKKRMSLEDAEDFLKSETFRVRYRLTRENHKLLMDCILKNQCPESPALTNKFYLIKNDLERRLYEEIDLSNSDQYLRVDFPEDKKDWSQHWVSISSSGSGKSYHEISKIIQNLKGNKRNRRQFVYASTELEEDKTLERLMKPSFRPWVTGVDTSEKAFESWKEEKGGSEGRWFAEEILPHFKNIPRSGHLVLDDPRDSPAAKQLMAFQNKAFRTLRHQHVGVTSIQHALRGGFGWTSQAFSSVAFIQLFPIGGGRGKIVDFVAKDIGLGFRRAREVVQLFAETGRVMVVRMHSPGALIGNKLLLLT